MISDLPSSSALSSRPGPCFLTESLLPIHLLSRYYWNTCLWDPRLRDLESSAVLLVNSQVRSDNSFLYISTLWGGIPRWASGKGPTCRCRRHEKCAFDPWIGKIWKRKWHPSPVFLPGESPRQRSLPETYSPQDHKDSDTTEAKHSSSSPFTKNLLCWLSPTTSLKPCLRALWGVVSWAVVLILASLVAQMVRSPPAVQEIQFWSLDQEDPLEEGVTTHCSILAWRILWTEESGGLQSMGSTWLSQTWLSDWHFHYCHFLLYLLRKHFYHIY